MDSRLSELTTAWGLSEVTPLAKTATASLWRVKAARGAAVLKIFTAHGREEIAGAALLAWWRGDGAARVYAQTPDAVLMEWVPGPSLVALSRGGRDREAAEILARLAVPRGLGALPRSLHRLEDWLAPLTALHGAWPDDIARAAPLARKLLSQRATAEPLHGDLHHENVVSGPRGWLVIDPKGLVGDRGFEVSAALRNPLGAESLTHNPERIMMLAAQFAVAIRQDERRVLDWAIVGTAISAVWDSVAGNDADATLRLLPILWAVARSANPAGR